MSTEKEKTLFIGGFHGVGKTSGKDFYILNFAKEHDYKDKPNDKQIGWDSIQCFVDAPIFEEFKGCKGGIFILASIVYVRGGWVLMDYSFK